MSEGHDFPVTKQWDLHLPFAGIPTFLRSKYIDDITKIDADVAMLVAGQGCDQQVKVLPQKSDVFRELAATLKKC